MRWNSNVCGDVHRYTQLPASWYISPLVSLPALMSCTHASGPKLNQVKSCGWCMWADGYCSRHLNLIGCSPFTKPRIYSSRAFVKAMKEPRGWIPKALKSWGSWWWIVEDLSESSLITTWFSLELFVHDNDTLNLPCAAIRYVGLFSDRE